MDTNAVQTEPVTSTTSPSKAIATSSENLTNLPSESGTTDTLPKLIENDNQDPDDESGRIPFPELALGEEAPIDDDEFNIPQIDIEPSLESILNELDTESLSDEGDHDLNLCGGGSAIEFANLTLEASDTASIQSRESCDNRSRTSSRSSRKPKEKKPPASILRHVLLKGLTSQINSAVDKINSGPPTSIAIGLFSIAVGTSHGYVLVFDIAQVLKWCLGEPQMRASGGAVSSLAISGNGNRLLVGYAKGLVLMYDLEAGKLLRTITDCHAAATAVVMLRFTDHPTLALCSDSGGSVFELTFKRTIVRGCESRCVFSGSRGEVCTFEPLLFNGFDGNLLSRHVIVAMATLSKVIVVSIRPKLKVLFTQPLTANPHTLPLLAWQMVIIQTTTGKKVVDPVLAFGRGNGISFYQATYSSRNTIQFHPLRQLTTNFTLLNLHWINPRTLVLLDIKEKLHLIDVRSQEELESVDLAGVGLVYASSHFKGLATGGNVSRAFALAGERACYNSILSINNQLVLLGAKSVHALTMRLWHERLDHLVKQGHYKEAVQLGYELYSERARAVVGLRGSRDAKRGVVGEKTLYILDQLTDRIPFLNYMEDFATAKGNYYEVISSCVNYYVLFDCLEPIFSKLYENCGANPIAKAAYLEALEPFILNDRLRSPPPTIVKEFVTHYEESGNWKALEACIVHLNVDTLDIHQTMKLCWEHGLYDAIIYIYTKGMNDYLSPLEELVTELRGAIKTESNLTTEQLNLGNKILVYTSCCLAGRAYPYGDIAPELVEKVQADVFQCMTTLHSRNASESEESYPYLKTLLKFDTREFLNVLSLSFEEPVFQTELGKRQKQRLVDILLQSMVTEQQSNFTPTEVGVLFTFLARQMARPDNSLFVSTLLFEQVLEHLTSANETTRIDERQQALLELLQAGGLQHLESSKLLARCWAAKFYRVCETLYERSQEYDKIVQCYLFDNSRKHQVFSFIHKILCTVPGQTAKFGALVKTHLSELIEIDHKKTAQIICHHFYESISDFVKSLETVPQKQYAFLKGTFLLTEQAMAIPTTEKYIELMCDYEPRLVCTFLKMESTNYRPEKVMEICKGKGQTDAVVYLLEKDAKYLEAFTILRQEFENLLEEVILESPSLTKLHHQLQILTEFSQRNSSKLSSKDGENLWLPILNLLISSSSKYQGTVFSSEFSEMNKHWLGCMMSHVSLTTVVEVVMNSPSYSGATFEEIRGVVMGMLDTCGYEETMVHLVKRISESDVHTKLEKKYKTVRRGFTVSNRICPCCRAAVLDSSGTSGAGPLDVVVFQCGHSFHVSCTENYGITGCPQCRSSPSSGSNVPQDIVFHAERSFLSTNGIDFETEDTLPPDPNEFELKLDAPFKVTPKEF